MNSLEFINEEIEKLKAFLELDDVLCELSDNDYKLYNDRLKTLQQIKAELEAWKFVKEEVGFAIENIEGSRSSDFWGCKYGLKCYDEGIIPLSDKETETFIKALEVKK